MRNLMRSSSKLAVRISPSFTEEEPEAKKNHGLSEVWQPASGWVVGNLSLGFKFRVCTKQHTRESVHKCVYQGGLSLPVYPASQPSLPLSFPPLSVPPLGNDPAPTASVLSGNLEMYILKPRSTTESDTRSGDGEGSLRKSFWKKRASPGP